MSPSERAGGLSQVCPQGGAENLEPVRKPVARQKNGIVCSLKISRIDSKPVKTQTYGRRDKLFCGNFDYFFHNKRLHKRLRKFVLRCYLVGIAEPPIFVSGFVKR